MVGSRTTWAVCFLAIVATAWLGFDSGLFLTETVGSVRMVAVFGPYLGLALLAWACRRQGARAVLPVVAALVSAYGLFFFGHDWYWPKPTNPNPWRVGIIAVVAIPQWIVVGLTAVFLGILRLWPSRRSNPLQ